MAARWHRPSPEEAAPSRSSVEKDSQDRQRGRATGGQPGGLVVRETRGANAGLREPEELHASRRARRAVLGPDHEPVGEGLEHNSVHAADAGPQVRRSVECEPEGDESEVQRVRRERLQD